MTMSDSKNKTTINSVTKSLRVLDLLAKNPTGLQIKEISSDLKLNLSSTYHLLNTFLLAGYIQKTSNDKYTLGYKIPYLNHAYLQSGVSSYNLSSFLRELQVETQETCYLGIEQNQEIIIGEILESSQAIKISALYVGFKGYAHARATTKAIMAYWPEEKTRLYFRDNPMEMPDGSPAPSIDRLVKELQDIKGRGYSLDEDAFVSGISCVACPIFNAGKTVIASFSVSMPSDRYQSKRSELIRQVCETARRASKFLGYADGEETDDGGQCED
ncbi:hypothetical protein DQG23_22130 [Paenibacillus contaminans]|uniref:IclR family transcriptional regulator n=2 Tax=Paenibacillus contaminans TaxID=450362 RepID=A0A329MIP8_9BACL|nr:hypothetical protein DQG23_22130 [Paenibacillus contaminans]